MLKPGVAFYLRTFHGFVTELVRAAWLRYVRRQNADAVGDASDLAALPIFYSWERLRGRKCLEPHR